MDDTAILKNRLTELSERSFSRGIWAHSEFLSLAEQSALLSLRLSAPYTLAGGWPSAERRIAWFGSEELCGWAEEPPIACVKAEPVNARFADKLAHRDLLGALMSLGIRREVTGDIVIADNVGYIFCLESIAEYMISELASVKHTTVKCSLTEPPTVLVTPPDISSVVISSERLDAIISAVYKLSRGESQELILSEKVFISGRLTVSRSAGLKKGDIVSVRGHGRFLYEGVERETKKGRLRVLVRVYR